LQEPADKNGKLKRIWEYACPSDGVHPNTSPTGGNVLELPDNSLFVSVGIPFSKLFIVSRDKKILWSAFAEEWHPEEKTWRIMGQYRASIILDRKAIEKLVWNVNK
jgi:hypothetical protein